MSAHDANPEQEDGRIKDLRDGARAIELGVESSRGDAVECASLDRWLVVPGAVGGRNSDALHGVGLTTCGAIAVYVRHISHRWPPSVHRYDRLDDVPRDQLPDDVREHAARMLGEKFVTRLDT